MKLFSLPRDEGNETMPVFPAPGGLCAVNSIGGDAKHDCLSETMMIPERTAMSINARSRASAVLRPPVVEKRTRLPSEEPQILACLDEDTNRLEVAKHARAISKALGLRLGFAQIVETAPHGAFPADPVEWNLRFAECRDDIGNLIERERDSISEVRPVVLPGNAHERLIDWAEGHRGSVLVLARHSGRSPHSGLGSTADRVLKSGAASILLLPSGRGKDCSADYRKLLVPLDGSPSSESVLPVVARLAQSRKAQVTLAHIASRTGELRSIENYAHSGKSNANACARDYLETWRVRLIRQGVDASLYFETGNEPHERLNLIASQLETDLIVIASHGQTNLADTPYGSVAGALAKNAPCPTFIVRPELQIPMAKAVPSTLMFDAPAAETEFFN